MFVKLKNLSLLMALGRLACLAAGAQNWQPTTLPNKSWSGVAVSAFGTKQVAISYFDWSYYLSTDTGRTWTSNSEPQYNSMSGSWTCIASSALGSTLLAGNVSSSLWVSTNSGAGWNSNNVPGVSAWGAVACSADGSKLFAAVGGNGQSPGLIYMSTNAGATWNPTGATNDLWMGLAASADGNKLVAVSGGSDSYAGSVYTSTNAGATWMRAMAPSNFWHAVASSADGTHFAAVTAKAGLPFAGDPGNIYTSSDSGVTWKSNNVPSDYFETVAISGDGSRVLASAVLPFSSVNTYYSADFGTTWISNNVPASAYSVAVGASADGGLLLAAPAGGQPEESQTVVSPMLSLAPAGQKMILSWLASWNNFPIQQSSNLVTWATVHYNLSLEGFDFTNLQLQVSLPFTNNLIFYRLATP
jgi:hypothetical protein